MEQVTGGQQSGGKQSLAEIAQAASMPQAAAAMQPVAIAVTGPTASGKTRTGMEVALKLGGEIVNADSRQVYERLDIGTAKPSPEELRRVPHHLIGHVPLRESYTAGRFAKEGEAVVLRLLSDGKPPIIVGGSGLYVQALIDGLFDGPEADPGLRQTLELRYNAEGIESMYAELLSLDPDAAAFVPKTNIPRVIRALEVCLLTGEPFSRLRTERLNPPGFRTLRFALRWNRETLYQRINNRVLQMLDAGLVEEVESLLAQGVDPSIQALNTVGYKETAAYLHGSCTYEDMVAGIQQHTRNFAKRQMTWFRKVNGMQWIDVETDGDLESAANVIVKSYVTTIDREM